MEIMRKKRTALLLFVDTAREPDIEFSFIRRGTFGDSLVRVIAPEAGRRFVQTSSSKAAAPAGLPRAPTHYVILSEWVFRKRSSVAARKSFGCVLPFNDIN